MKNKVRDAIILDVLTDVYGESIYCPILASELDEKLDEWKAETDSYRTVEEQIRLRVWDFFSGGDTAEVVARRIKMKLYEAGEW